ncbi:immunoglobulin superfamily member 11-like [Sinocyclocheilus rhinocerous]|uniref:immunoglobulin superfamily member 11-like n=1 Tax=Sinocyclocheilus rhinocerous TaxID=307959 RepID=UPI0007B8C620|nr:PREDICTED: immunoglobulin superfamily member 11-like [Sinocyclocheilus rhinocerous]
MLKFHNSDLWIAWLVFFCVNVCVCALEVTVSQSSVQVARGQAAVLPCTFTTSAALNNVYIIWMVTPLANANQPEQTEKAEEKGRNHERVYDADLYSLSAPAVPPSIPTCRIQGSLDVGNDVMLLCGSDEGIPTPTYAWEKQESVLKLPHNAMQGTKPLPVGIPFCFTFSGCVTAQPQSVGLIAGTIATAILALLICSLLVLVTLFYWRNKNKYEEEEIPNEIR